MLKMQVGVAQFFSKIVGGSRLSGQNCQGFFCIFINALFENL
jgi:hypothetical protein